MSAVTAIAIDSSGNIYVLDGTDGKVFVFVNGASGLSAPIHTLTTASITSSTGIAIDGGNNLYLIQFLLNSVAVFPPGADGAASPIRTFTTDTSQVAIAVDSAGTTFVAPCVSPGTVEEFAAGDSGASSPIATLQGANTLLNCPTGLAI
jgi:hypothetical protein